MPRRLEAARWSSLLKLPSASPLAQAYTKNLRPEREVFIKEKR